MAVEAAIDAEKLIQSQVEDHARFFGIEVTSPPNLLFEVLERNRQEKLFKPDRLVPYLLPRRSFPEGISFPGQRVAMGPNLYRYIKEGWVDKSASSLLDQWVILDVARRPRNKGGKQMYPDTKQFKEILAELRNQGQIKVPSEYRHVPKDSRFAISPDELDGSKAVVAQTVAKILRLETTNVTLPPYAVFYYVGNLAHPEFGQVDTSEWFADRLEHGLRLLGGDSCYGGLSDVDRWLSAARDDDIGFRLQIAFSSQA